MLSAIVKPSVKPDLGKIYCACSNCIEKSYCLAEIACYRASRSKYCENTNGCFGCFNDQFQSLQCGINRPNIAVACCTNSNYCNQNLTIPQHELEGHEANGRMELEPRAFQAWLLIMMLPFMIFVLIACSILTSKIWAQVKSAKEEERIKNKFKKFAMVNMRPRINHYVSKVDLETELKKATNRTPSRSISTTTTGTGQGELIQRTMARDLRIDYERGLIGQGRYGHVWVADWNEEKVAVKVFSSMHESAWARETDIYQTCMLHHENILGFIASDIKASDDSVSMILVTKHHPLGSLYDFLKSSQIETKEKLFKLVYSISNGLNHLHTEIFSAKYKPSIVHRDLKSKNILVKNNMECCISDFDLAVRYNSQLGKFDHNDSSVIKIQEGSVRYMAPECLNQTLNPGSIDELKRADIYSFSLVIWEILSRYAVNGHVAQEPYQLPYSQHVAGDPKVDEMRLVVCERRLRPSLSFENSVLESNSYINQLVDMMKECWQEKPIERLNSLRIKKNIKQIFS